ncbi:fimbrial protein [Providencia rettgeri]|uniref:fimbrial protein n=1 Tax=Providencia rettgeri TaxID=587 RepID=UPI0023AADC20|nr:fimbrial protein [Providencia rettgeri]
MKKFGVIFSLALGLFCDSTFANSNTATITFDAFLYKKTCDVNVSESAISYGKVKPKTIIDNDAKTSTELNRDITLTLANCRGSGTLSGSKVIVNGKSQIINGESLFKESGSSDGVGIRLISGTKIKQDDDSVWDLISTSGTNSKQKITAALSCGDCQDVKLIKAGSFRATMTFTVLAY